MMGEVLLGLGSGRWLKLLFSCVWGERLADPIPLESESLMGRIACLGRLFGSDMQFELTL